jgi:hypothetical protein
MRLNKYNKSFYLTTITIKKIISTRIIYIVNDLVYIQKTGFIFKII